MAVRFNGTSQSASFTATLPAGLKAVTVCYWIKLVPFAVRGSNVVVNEYSTNYNSNTGTWLHYRTSLGDRMEFAFKTPTGYAAQWALFDGTNSGPHSRWHAITAVHRIGNTSTGQGYNRVFYDGKRVGLATQTMNSTDDTGEMAQSFAMYLMARAGTSLYAEGDMAEYGVAAGEWDERMAKDFARGIPFPKVAGCRPLHYFPMHEPSSDNRSEAGDKSALLTYTNAPTGCDHPPIIQPFRRLRLISDKNSPAGGGVTGTLAATETGSDTAAFAGDVLVQGTLAATESGSDTAAFAGDVLVIGSLAATDSADVAAFAGDVVVQGTLAATDASDTAAFAGDVLVQGALAATETGSDVANFIGDGASPAITGSLATTESGSDAAAFAGDVLVQGALAATDSADTATITGAVRVLGALAAVETGSDTAAFTSGALTTRPKIIALSDVSTTIRISDASTTIRIAA